MENWITFKRNGKNINRANLNHMRRIFIDKNEILFISVLTEDDHKLKLKTEEEAQAIFDRICNGATEIEIS